MNYFWIILFGLFAIPISGAAQSYHSTDTPDSLASLAPCTEPLTWRIGDIDPRFDIDVPTVKALMADVNALWSDAAGKQVFAYSDTAQVTLNFIYGKAQEATDSERALLQRIDWLKQEHNVLKEEYEALIHLHEIQTDAYNEQFTVHEQKVNAYNWSVQRNSNSRVIEELEQKRLLKLQDQILRSQKELGSMKEKLNAGVVKLQDLSALLEQADDRVNKLIYAYNRRFSSWRTFYGGVYIDGLNHQKINIYEFASRHKLRLVLAHEAGHVLGIGHLADPTSIMHFKLEYQRAETLQLSEEDTRAIRDLCNSKGAG